MQSSLKFHDALTAQMNRAVQACDAFSKASTDNFETLLRAADKLEAAFQETIAGVEKIAKRSVRP